MAETRCSQAVHCRGRQFSTGFSPKCSLRDRPLGRSDCQALFLKMLAQWLTASPSQQVSSFLGFTSPQPRGWHLACSRDSGCLFNTESPLFLTGRALFSFWGVILDTGRYCLVPYRQELLVRFLEIFKNAASSGRSPILLFLYLPFLSLIK